MGSPRNLTRFRNEWIDLYWILGLLLAALLLFGLDLGGVALRDWDEGIVAQVAREITRGDLNWLYPTLHDAPYFNKPPLVHNLIAWVYQFTGIHEWSARLPSAILSAFSVPVLYALGLELFRQRPPAVFSALVYLTLLPVVRQGRLAMLEGAVLFLLVVMMWCVLRSRRDLRYALGSGLAFGLLCLTKGILLGLLLGAIAFLFLLWDTPRLLQCRYLWLGLLLGAVPVLGWYLAQWQHYGQLFFQANLLSQSLQRIWEPVENNQGAPWYYVIEILKYAWPWHLFWIPGLQLSWRNRNFSWGKLILVWTAVYFLAVSLMSTKLPWYILPLYPAMALAVGFYFAQVWQESDGTTGRWHPTAEKRDDLPTLLPNQLQFIFILLGVVGWAGCLYFGGLIPLLQPPTIDFHLQFTLGALGLTFTLVSLLIVYQDRQFLIVLVWGMYLSLLLFVTSNHWVWELAEDYAVKPVAELIQNVIPTEQKIYTSHPYSRPTLNFYTDRKIRPAEDEELQQKWQQSSQPYFLLDPSTLSKLKLQGVQKKGTVEGWTLVTREVESAH